MQSVILLTEDEAAVRELAAFILERDGFRVLQADGALQALQILQRGDRIDLLLTDIQMEGMNGIELAQKVVCEKPETRILLMSGFPGYTSVVADHGFAFLPKPFTADALVTRVHAELIPRKSVGPEGITKAKVLKQCG
jgi:two-component system cell cycle sensor histidine kinase/response regulator CckA